MANNKNIPPPAQFIDLQTGFLTRQANNFLNSITRSSNEAAAGEVATPPGSGLEGGGSVADGIDLSIAPNGVTNVMIRESAATSVIGRRQNSAGDVADVIAVANRTVFQRRDDQLAFWPDLDVPAVATDALTINDTPAASTATVTHSIPIETDGGTMYILLSNAP